MTSQYLGLPALASYVTCDPEMTELGCSYCYINLYACSKSTEPLIGHGKIKIAPCIKSCARDDLVITIEYGGHISQSPRYKFIYSSL